MIRNAAKITFANKSLCFKVLNFRLIVYAICFVICFFLARASIIPIIKSDEVADLFETLRGFVSDFLNATPSDIGNVMSTVNVQLGENLSALLKLISSQMGVIIGSIIGIVVVYLVEVFLLGMFDYTVGVIINGHMSSFQHAKFFNTLFENFSSACSYGLYRMIALFTYNLVMYSLMVGFGVGLFYLIDFLALPFIVLFFILIIVIRQTFAGQTLPNMICGEMSVFNAFKANFKNLNKNQLSERFMSYSMLGIIMFAVIVATAAATFNVALLLTVPFNAVIYSAIKFVDYYQMNGKKYYVTYDDIVIPKELRDNDEQLLNKVDIF